MKPILGYWDLRGRASPIRMLLHHVGVDFEDKRYRDPAEWFGKDKIKLAKTVDFPNLPYYIDDEVKMTQSRAIIHHLGRKYNLDGSSEQELVRMHIIYEQIIELSEALMAIARSVDVENRQEIHDTLRKAYLASLPSKLEAIAKFIGKDDWMGGKKLTYIDFMIYDVLDFHRVLFDPKHVNEFPTLVAYLTRVEGLKGVSEYLASDAFHSLPIYGPMGMFGGTKDYKPID